MVSNDAFQDKGKDKSKKDGLPMPKEKAYIPSRVVTEDYKENQSNTGDHKNLNR